MHRLYSSEHKQVWSRSEATNTLMMQMILTIYTLDEGEEAKNALNIRIGKTIPSYTVTLMLYN